jgi:hypothetical protein
MKRIIVFAMALVAASTLFARGHAPYRPSPFHSSHHYHHHHHGSGGAIAAGIVGGALLGGLVASAVSTPAPVVVTPAPTVVTPAPVVVQQPVVVQSAPVVVQQPVYQTQNVWVEGRYVDTVQPNGTVLRTWQPGHYEQRTIQVQ